MQSMKMKKEEMGGVLINSNRSESSASTAATHHVGNKVLPITSDTAALPPMAPSSRKGGSGEQDEKPDSKLKGDNNNNNNNNKSKAISRMKDLIRWAATTKPDKNGKFLGRKVLQQFRNGRSALKGIQYQIPTGRSNYSYENSNHIDSPRFSLRWEVESSCSTTCSAMSMASCPAALHVDRRKANWITTDSDFVVLEL